MKTIIEIIQTILALFARNKKEKLLTPRAEYKPLGVDATGEEWGTTADLSEEDLQHAQDQFDIDFQEDKNIICNNHEILIDWEDTILWLFELRPMCQGSRTTRTIGSLLYR